MIIYLTNPVCYLGFPLFVDTNSAGRKMHIFTQTLHYYHRRNTNKNPSQGYTFFSHKVIFDC